MSSRIRNWINRISNKAEEYAGSGIQTTKLDPVTPPTTPSLKSKGEMVVFNDGTFGFRRFNDIREHYEFLDLKSENEFWWPQNSVHFKDSVCKDLRDINRRIDYLDKCLNPIIDYGSVVSKGNGTPVESLDSLSIMRITNENNQ